MLIQVRTHLLTALLSVKALFVSFLYDFVFFLNRYFIISSFYRVFFFPTLRQMCNTNMSVSTEGAVSTSQIPASEQETLVGIFVPSVTLTNSYFMR